MTVILRHCGKMKRIVVQLNSMKGKVNPPWEGADEGGKVKSQVAHRLQAMGKERLRMLRKKGGGAEMS